MSDVIDRPLLTTFVPEVPGEVVILPEPTCWDGLPRNPTRSGWHRLLDAAGEQPFHWTAPDARSFSPGGWRSQAEHGRWALEVELGGAFLDYAPLDHGRPPAAMLSQGYRYVAAGLLPF